MNINLIYYAVCLCSFTTQRTRKWGTLHIMSPAQKVGVMSPLRRELYPWWLSMTVGWLED